MKISYVTEKNKSEKNDEYVLQCFQKQKVDNFVTMYEDLVYSSCPESSYNKVLKHYSYSEFKMKKI